MGQILPGQLLLLTATLVPLMCFSAEGVGLDTAVIVEVRRHPLLVPVVHHMLQHIPNSTIVQVFHGPRNEQTLRSNFREALRVGRVVLTRLNHTNMDIPMYNDLFYSVDFWEGCIGERIVVFQTDSAVCSLSPYSWADFLDPRWDFIGPPFRLQWKSKHQNGGFSLRRKSKMILALQKLSRTAAGDLNEDRFFSLYAAKQGIVRPAPLKVARKFAVETLFYASPFAIHKAWAYQSAKQLSELRRCCPELRTLFHR
eukprot:GGOE01018049.1.p1 GENE.GGOE01018049.1~~GGOE01018049.1.p1  ORF type:complete len:255 (+),score=69.38 GGOE01018049.1:67-831(+)